MRGVAFISLISLMVLVGCQSESQSPEARAIERKSNLPSSNGTHNELTLFCDRSLWEDGLGISLLESLAKPMEGLPMAEPHFDLSRVDQKAVSSLTKRSKSILSLAVIPDSSATLVIRDLWAEPQLVILIIAPSAEQLKVNLQQVLPGVIEKFDDHDARVLIQRIKGSQKHVVPASLRDFGVSAMSMAKGFKTTFSEAHCAILREDTRNSIQYLLGWDQPWDGESDPSQAILDVQNTYLNSHFEGVQEGSYLAIEPRIPVVQAYREINKRFTYISRGQFRTEGGFGGGPFVTYSYIDETQERIVSLCYLLYGPSMKKRKVMMEFESSLQSVKWAK
ncbi:MAG: DUF4837 family protein [Cryomorphaceae bacterium]|jgi:hypothetical protein|nr:DUF4837 family protein [Cryomorphaceae bacterium]